MAKNKRSKCPPYSDIGAGPGADSQDLSSNPLVIKNRTYVKHREHWYDDGNIAFLVEDKAFRLHGSILSKRSPVMANLLSLPRPSPPNPFNGSDDKDVVIDGVPCVVLHDKARDFAHLLDFIYPNTLPVVRTAFVGVHDLMGIVRLAGKYLVDDLLQWAISKLGRNFLLLPENRSVKGALEDVGRYGNPELCVQVIQFSRECSLPQFLPLAFYALATKDWDAHFGRAICLQQLPAKDQCRIQEGRVALAKDVFENAFIMAENHGPAAKCSSWSCSKIQPTMWGDSRERWENLVLHPLEELEHRLSLAHANLCEKCRTGMERRTQAYRDRLVNRLTELFRLA